MASSPVGRHLTYSQRHRGLPVLDAFLKLNIDPQGRFLSGFSTLIALDESTPTAPAGTQAWWPGPEGLLPVTLDTLMLAGQPVVQMTPVQGGAPVHTRSLASFFQDTTGRGYVYLPDPLTSAQVPYGCPYCDNSNATSAELDAQRVEVTLQDITFQAGQFSLTGPYARIVDVAGPINPPPTSADGNFFYDRSQPPFEAVSVYYHIDTFQRYIQSLGFFGLGNDTLYVDPQGTSSDNSFFLAIDPPQLWFGTGGIDDAEDADVVIHEYGHYLSYSAAPGSNLGTERQGLDEGICDYLAASYSLAISSFGAERVFNWDGNTPAFPGRSVDVPYTYTSLPDSNIYTIGSLWASAMVEVRRQRPRAVVDRIQLTALYFNAPFMRLPDAALEVLRADSLLYAQQNRPYLLRAFARRQLLPQGYPIAVTDTLLPDILTAQEPARLFPNPAAGSTNLFTRTDGAGRSPSYRLLAPTGQLVQSGLLQAGLQQLALPATAGVYIVQLQWPDGTQWQRRVLVTGPGP